MAKSFKDFGKDKSSFANLPQEVTHKAYPKNENVSSDLDDTMVEIDKTINKSVGKEKKYVSNQH